MEAILVLTRAGELAGNESRGRSKRYAKSDQEDSNESSEGLAMELRNARSVKSERKRRTPPQASLWLRLTGFGGVRGS